MNAMKDFFAKPMLAAALLSALACSSEVAGASPETDQPAPTAETADTSGASKFNFSTPGETASAGGSGGFNFSVPEEGQAGSTALGSVALPEDGSADSIVDFNADIAAPQGN